MNNIDKNFKVKVGLAEMLKGGVIMDVTNPEQAKIAEDAGAAAVMALERIPSDIRRDGGVSRMSDPLMIEGIKKLVSIPVMAKLLVSSKGSKVTVYPSNHSVLLIASSSNGSITNLSLLNLITVSPMFK